MTPIMATADLHGDQPDLMVVDCDYRVSDTVKDLTGSRWDTKRHVWTLPLTWMSCITLRNTFGKGLKIGDGLRGWAVDEKERQSELTRLHYLLEDVGLEAADAASHLPGFDDLFISQKVAAEAINIAGSYALFDETGTGKGRAVMAGASLLAYDPETDTHDLSKIFPMLVVAPKSMIRTWVRMELPVFFPDADVSLVHGTPKQLEAAMEPGHDIYVTTYDVARKHSKHSYWTGVDRTAEQRTDGLLNKIGFKYVIADEIHRIQNPSSGQSCAVRELGDRALYRAGLTGTPIQENLEDLWAILRFIAPTVFSTKTTFVNRYAEIGWNDYGGREIKGLNPAHRDEFFQIIDAHFRRVTKKAALPFLPDKAYEVRWVDLPAKMRKAYNEMKTKMEAELHDGTILTSDSILERAGRLLQLANASGTVDADGKYTMELPSPKIDAFMEDLLAGDYDAAPLAVFCDSRQLIELLAEQMTKKKRRFSMITGSTPGDDRQTIIEEFQRGEMPYILFTRAAGEGVTLTAANTMVRLVRSWSYIVHTQVEDRIHRIGSERHPLVRYVDYLVDGTVEMNQIARLNSKGAASEEVLRDSDWFDILSS